MHNFEKWSNIQWWTPQDFKNIFGYFSTLFMKGWIVLLINVTLREKYFFWSVFSSIRNENGEIRSISSYSVEWGKIPTRKTLNTDLFHGLYCSYRFENLQNQGLWRCNLHIKVETELLVKGPKYQKLRIYSEVSPFMINHGKKH